METIEAYYDGSVFVPLAPVKAKQNQHVVVTFVEPKKREAKNDIDSLFGVLSRESYEEIMEALKDTERIDVDEW
jgi:predicted DNA-binding antitoxin AbrB/MazE fold protein